MDSTDRSRASKKLEAIGPTWGQVQRLFPQTTNSLWQVVPQYFGVCQVCYTVFHKHLADLTWKAKPRQGLWGDDEDGCRWISLLIWYLA